MTKTTRVEEKEKRKVKEEREEDACFTFVQKSPSYIVPDPKDVPIVLLWQLQTESHFHIQQMQLTSWLESYVLL